MKNIYLDHAATTPTDKEILDEIIPFFSERFGNPSSVHTTGQDAMNAVDNARNTISKLLNCLSTEIIFTSGATESNNFAIKGVVKAYYAQHGKNAPIPHIITTAIEHHCVLDTCKSLEKEGLAKVTYASVNKDGLVDVEKIREAVKENTLLISVMHVNNEIGTMQPIQEIGNMLEELNKQRDLEGHKKIYFHTDAVQAINYVNCDVSKLKVDMLSFSGHKIYGPKGIGALFIKKDVKIKPILDGGGQEFKLRAGTHNVPAIVGFGHAAKRAQENKEKNDSIQEVRDHLIDRVLKEIPASYLNGSKEKRIPNNANFRFDNIEGEGLLLSLDMEGISASTGSACSSGSLDPSHVLLALGLRHEQAHGSLRLTLGKNTTKEEIDIVVEKIKEIVERLRKISGNVLSEFEK
ncbi:MAG: cysteine desulfurase [Candidatus Moranbacteria bacterium]|nr:cysteine desulfurase [Candidatus Moranbacteria bacterium]